MLTYRFMTPSGWSAKVHADCLDDAMTVLGYVTTVYLTVGEDADHLSQVDMHIEDLDEPFVCCFTEH